MKNLHLTFILLIFVIGACKKDTTPSNSTPCTNCQSVNEAKDYFGFKVGTWWVYEEATSHERDSVYVTESTIDSTGYYFNVTLYSPLQNYYYHYWPTYYGNISGCSLNGFILKKCLFINRSKTKPGNFIGESNCFFIKYNNGDYSSEFNINFPNNKIIIDSIYDDFNSFGKTVKVHELSTLVENNQPTNHYYSKNIGITRKEFIDSNQVWNLVNYHIEP